MNKDHTIKAFTQGIAAALLAWIGYGAFTSLFDDTIIDKMFDSSGILFAVCMVIVAVSFFFRSAKKAETAKES